MLNGRVLEMDHYVQVFPLSSEGLNQVCDGYVLFSVLFVGPSEYLFIPLVLMVVADVRIIMLLS